MSTSSANSSGSTESKKPAFQPVDHGKVISAKLRRTDDGKDIALDFPEDVVDRCNLPPITIITITRDRKRFADLAIDNWKRVYYPDDKIFWLIVDDSANPKQDSWIEAIKALKDPRINYWYESPKRDEAGNAIPYTVGYKRNLAMAKVKTDIVAFMDDDDYLYDESILARVCCLKFYEKGCVYSAELGVYNIPQENSYFLEGFADVPEGSIMLTQEFWSKQKFGEEETQGEGRKLVSGRELDMIKIPSYFNMIVLNHGINTTGAGRVVRFAYDRKMKNKASVLAPTNFWKVFPVSFRDAVKRVAATSAGNRASILTK